MATRMNSADLPTVIVPSIGNSQHLIASSRRQVKEVLEMGRTITGLFAALWRSLINLQAGIDRANAMRGLITMNDRMLDDIGIHHEQIPMIIADRIAGWQPAPASMSTSPVCGCGR